MYVCSGLLFNGLGVSLGQNWAASNLILPITLKVGKTVQHIKKKPNKQTQQPDFEQMIGLNVFMSGGKVCMLYLELEFLSKDQIHESGMISREGQERYKHYADSLGICGNVQAEKKYLQWGFSPMKYLLCPVQTFMSHQ